MCKNVGLTIEEMEEMTVGMCLEFVNAYLEAKNPEDYQTDYIEASQTHFDNF